MSIVDCPTWQNITVQGQLEKFISIEEFHFKKSKYFKIFFIFLQKKIIWETHSLKILKMIYFVWKLPKVPIVTHCLNLATSGLFPSKYGEFKNKIPKISIVRFASPFIYFFDLQVAKIRH
jgi:hypothetical protein